MVFTDKDELVFDIATSEILKKGISYTTLKVKNLLQTKIALRVRSNFILDFRAEGSV